MKYLFLSIMLMSSFSSWALPILNRNVAPTGSRLTVWPDHFDGNVYHIVPNAFKLHQEEDPGFSFKQFYQDGEHFAVMWAPMDKWFNHSELLIVKNELLKLNPKARFEIVHLSLLNLNIKHLLQDFVDDFECRIHTEAIEFDFFCSMRVNSLGLKTIRPYLASGKTLAMSGEFQVDGVVERVGKQYEEISMPLGLPVIIGGEFLKTHKDMLTALPWEK